MIIFRILASSSTIIIFMGISKGGPDVTYYYGGRGKRGLSVLLPIFYGYCYSFMHVLPIAPSDV